MESGKKCTRRYVMPSISQTRLTKAAHLVMTKWITVSCMLKCNHNIYYSSINQMLTLL
jgi:hypothetical protein